MRRALATGTVLALMLGGALWFLGRKTDLWSTVTSLVYSEETVTEESIVLKQIREISELTTLAYVQKTVFPQDYFTDDPPTVLLARLRSEGKPMDQVLTPEEQRYLEAYNLAVDIGLLPYWGATDFVVVTTVVTMGYDLLNGPIGTTPEQQLIQTNSDSISFYLPQAEILGVEVEDIDQETYGYPAVRLQPEEWRQVVEFVAQTVRQEAGRGELPARARTNGLAFFETLLSPGDDRSVQFTAHPLHGR